LVIPNGFIFSIQANDPPINPTPFIYYNTPVNSMGNGNLKEVNWSFIDNCSSFVLKRDNVDVSYLLDINFSYYLNNRKYSYNFTADQKGLFNLTFTFDSLADNIQFFMNNYTVVFNYSDGNIFYNFSDIMLLAGNVDVGYFVDYSNKVFVLYIEKFLNKNVKVVLDPIFGYNTVGSSSQYIYEALNPTFQYEYMLGGYWQMGSNDGIADNITVRFGSLSLTMTYQCAIYEYVDYSTNYMGDLIELSSTKQVTSTQDNTWQTFDLSSTVCLSANTNYYICIAPYGDYTSFVHQNYIKYNSGSNGVFDKQNGGITLSDPYTGESATSKEFSIYCSYTEGCGEGCVNETLITPVSTANGTSNVNPCITLNWTTLINNTCGESITYANISCNGLYHNTSGVNGTYHLNITNLECGNSYTVYVNASSGGDVNRSWFTFSTSFDDIVFNFISQDPSNLYINDTGFINITYNVTSGCSGLNSSSLLIAHVLNNTRNLHLNNTYTLYAENWVADKKCAINRNYPYWFEQEFSYLTGDDSIGDIGEWGVHNISLYEPIDINSQGSNWLNFTHHIPILENLFGNIFLVNHEAMTIENKTGQTFNVYKDNSAKVYFNMSDTQWFTDTEYNNTYYTLHFFAEPVNPTENLLVYFANSSYVDGNPLISPYCELIGVVTPLQSYAYSVLNSSYYDISFSSDTNGTVGSVSMTDNFSFIFASNSKDSVEKWVIYYADDNITIIEEYHDFYNSSCTSISSDKGKTWVTQDATIDTFLTYGHLDNIDKIMYKVYCQTNCTTTGDGSWSSIHIDILDEANLQPNIPNVILPNGTDPTVNYTVGDIVNITYSWLGDPNLDTCWLNITVHDASHDIVYYLQNRSITSAEYEINNTWFYDWNTTGFPSGGPYHINVNATDPYGLYNDGEQQGVFYLLSVAYCCNVTLENEYIVNKTTGINATLTTFINFSAWINTTCTQYNFSFINISFVDDLGLNYSNQTNIAEGLIYVNMSVNLSCGSNYTFYINLSKDLINCSIISYSFWFRTLSCEGAVSCCDCFNDTCFTTLLNTWLISNGYVKDSDFMDLAIANSQLSIFLTLILFGLFFYIGYTTKRKSGGAFVMFSGFIFIGLSLLIGSYLNAIYVTPLMLPFAGFIILVGVKKWLYEENKKTEG